MLFRSVGLIFAYLAYIIYQFPVPLISFPNGTRLVQTLPMLSGALLFGLFGGTISSILRQKLSSHSPGRSEFTPPYLLTVMRVFMGAAAAIALFFILESQLFSMLLPQLDLRPSDGVTYFVLSFIAGFCERLLFRPVTKDAAAA